MKLGKCLMLVERTDMVGREFSKTAYLLIMDANERRQYATYLWMSREGKKYWEVPPMACELAPSLREKRFCKTREEFDEFAAPYMEHIMPDEATSSRPVRRQTDIGFYQPPAETMTFLDQMEFR